jgi:hypothetical protein
LSPKVDNKVEPDPTSISRSPFTLIVTGPEGDNFDLTVNKITTNNNISVKKTTILDKITVIIFSFINQFP